MRLISIERSSFTCTAVIVQLYQCIAVQASWRKLYQRTSWRSIKKGFKMNHWGWLNCPTWWGKCTHDEDHGTLHADVRRAVVLLSHEEIAPKVNGGSYYRTLCIIDCRCPFCDYAAEIPENDKVFQCQKEQCRKVSGQLNQFKLVIVMLYLPCLQRLCPRNNWTLSFQLCKNACNPLSVWYWNFFL